MAVVKMATLTKWIGLSTDTKESVGVLAGSRFHETDTHYDYIWDGTAWQLDYSVYPPEEDMFG